MIDLSFTFTDKCWLWQGKGAWHFITLPEDKSEEIADEVGKSLDSKHSWYADFKNEKIHFIIFRDKVFKIDRRNKKEYDRRTSPTPDRISKRG